MPTFHVELNEDQIQLIEAILKEAFSKSEKAERVLITEVLSILKKA